MSRTGVNFGVILLLGFGLLGVILTAAQNARAEWDKDAFQPLPAESVRAWENAGASSGWMYWKQIGLRFRSGRGVHGQRDELPAFQWPRARRGVIAFLPAPSQVFGLDFRFTSADDALLQELAGLKELQTLGLAGTKITDAGIKQLTRLTKLRSLDLSGTSVTDDGLKDLRKLKQLQVLNLSITTIGDAGLKSVRALTHLELLGLHATEISDAGLKSLSTLPRLRLLSLYGTRVTAQACRDLRESLPNLLICVDDASPRK